MFRCETLNRSSCFVQVRGDCYGSLRLRMSDNALIISTGNVLESSFKMSLWVVQSARSRLTSIQIRMNELDQSINVLRRHLQGRFVSHIGGSFSLFDENRSDGNVKFMSFANLLPRSLGQSNTRNDLRFQQTAQQTQPHPCRRLRPAELFASIQGPSCRLCTGSWSCLDRRRRPDHELLSPTTNGLLRIQLDIGRAS